MERRKLNELSISFFVVVAIVTILLSYSQISKGAAEQNEYVWVSMDGPPGGGVSVLKQNPYKRDELYAGAPPGFFVSNDQGTTFRRIGIPTLTYVNSISLAENFAVVTADFVYSYDYQTEDMDILLESPATTFLHGDDLYIVTFSSSDNKLECGIFRIAGLDLSARIDMDTQVPLSVIQIDMPVLETQTLFDITIPNILMVEDTLLITVGFIDHTGIYTYAEHKIVAINTGDGSYRIINHKLPEDLVLTKISQNPENPQHLVLVARNKRVGDTKARPISKLIYESTDGGSTWDTFTNNTFYQYHMIKDIDFSGGRIFFPRVADWILSVDASDHSSWERIDMPFFGNLNNRVAWLDWLNFDTNDPRIVYGGLDIESGFTGVIRSTDGMQSWEIIGDGIPSSQPSNVDIHPENGSILVTSGNIAHYPHITRDSGATWQRLLEETSMGDELVFDPHNPNHLVLVSEITDLLQTWDMGENWESLSERFHASRIFDLEASSQGNGQLFASLFGIGISQFPSLNSREQILSGPEARFQWEHMYGSSDYAYDLELDPKNNKILYASYSPKFFENHASVFRYDGSTNGDAVWEEILKVENSTGISSITIDQKNPDRIYTGVLGERGRILTSNDRGNHWEPLSEDLTFSTIHEMAIDPNDLVAYAAPWGGGLFKTTDGGMTWNPLDVPTVSVASIVINPNNPDHIYIGDRTQPYVFETHDGGREWVPTVHFDRDMLYRVSAMVFHKGALYISVFNRVDKKISLFDEGPMSGTTFVLRDRNVQELEGGMTRAAIGFCSMDNALYAVSHIRGVFKLEDNSWVDISGNLPDMGFNSITTDDNGTLYLAGGCDISLYGPPRVDDPSIINNIYQSQDGGITWNPVLEGNAFGGPVKKVLAHPTEQDMLVAATSNGIFISRNHGQTWNKQDDGFSFKNVGALALGQNRVYAGTLGGGVFSGTSGQGTLAWSGTTGPYPEIFNIRIVLNPSDSQVIYATAYPGGVFKSQDRGLTWIECNFGLPSFQVVDPFLEGYYDLAVNPVNPDILWLGIYGYGIYVSRDAAATWVPIYAINNTEPILRDLKTKRVVFDPVNRNHVYIASEKGVLFTGDLGSSWEALHSGLDTHDIISLEISDDGSVFAGSNGYGVYSLNKETKIWHHMNRTIGFGEWAPWERRLYMYAALLFDPTVEGRIYMGNFPGGFFVSNDDGNTWECSSLGLGNDGIFSLCMHPYNHEVIFAGTYNGVWKTENQGKSWSQTSNGMPDEQWPFCVVIDDQNPSIMYTATKNGMNKGFMSRNEFGGVVMKSIDGGENWFKMMNGLQDMSEYYQLIIHPDNHNILFVSSTFGIFMSNDAGKSWEPFNEGLPEKHFYIRDNVAENLKITPDGKYLVFGITAHGVWRVDITGIAGN